MPGCSLARHLIMNILIFFNEITDNKKWPQSSINCLISIIQV